ncbi:MAG: hypothetical protein U0931_22750 [Vulcanimicrobiota bacterium]
MVIQKAPPISINLLPQDPMISKPELVQVDRVQFGDNLSGPRLHTQDSVPVARADADGNYLYELGTPEFDQVNTHGIVSQALATYERYTGHVMPWSFKGPLQVNPHAGEGKTAYYSRWDQSINFFQWDSPSLGKTVKTSQAFDVGSHEIGHAILDGIRPGLLSGTEGKAFHEGFGDSSAIIHALQYDTNLQQILVDNGGDFSKPSLITRLAEEFGSAFNKEDDNPNNDDHPYYRTALNEFKYKDPKQLPSDSYPPSQPEEVLTSEPHSFSRIWSGSFYSMLGALYNQCAADAPSQLEALRQARDVLGTVWGQSLDHLPAANLKFRHVASGVLREAASLEGGKYFDSLAAVMLDRNLLTQEQVDECHQGPKSELRLSAFPQTRAGAQDMLSLLGRDQEGWKADLALPGAEGRRVYTFRAPQRVDLDLGARGPAFMQAEAGLTLVFDAQGQLISQTCTPLSAEDRADLQRDARAMADSGQLVGEDGIGPARLVSRRQGTPEFQVLPAWKD